jgi:hypothetical protein
MIVLFPSGGRIGNHLFQLAYVTNLARPGERIVTRGFGRTRGYLRGEWKKRWIDVDSRFLGWLIESAVEPLCWQLLIKTGLVSSIIETGDKALSVKKGKIPLLTIVKGYFETDDYISESSRERFRLERKYIDAARSTLGHVVADRTLLFVHIRKSDIGFNRIHGKSVELPDSYYRNAVAYLQKFVDKPFLIIVGDSPSYAETLFHDVQEKYVSHLTPPEDLALMSLCSGGVLSNSTFAWWGAFMGRPGGLYIGPKYWWGWASGEWYPPGMKTSLITEYLEVREDD